MGWGGIGLDGMAIIAHRYILRAPSVTCFYFRIILFKLCTLSRLVKSLSTVPTISSVRILLKQKLRKPTIESFLGRCANNQNGNLRWHLPLGVRPPPLMAQISRHFFTPLFSFAIESYIYETDFI